MTPWERKLWHLFLKDYPLRIYRQRVIGRCIVDFYCDAAKLAIELDGSQHFEMAGSSRDAARDSFPAERGVEVLRIPNNLIDRRFREACELIDREIRDRLEK